MTRMNEGILSQEEIDALLKGQGQSEPAGTALELTDIEEDTLGEVGNICMGTSATTLSTLLGKKVSITTPRIRYATCNQLRSDYPMPYLVVEVRYREGLKGSNMLVIKKNDASMIADLMMGGDGDIAELNDLSLSAVSEAMNQMMGSATTSMSSMFEQRIDIYPPKLSMVDFGGEDRSVLDGDYENLVQISFKMVIENLLDSEIMQLIPVAYAREMVKILRKDMPDPDTGGEQEPFEVSEVFNDIPGDHEWDEAEGETSWTAQAGASSMPSKSKDPSLSKDNRSGFKKGQVGVRPVQFTGLDETSTYQEGRNIDIILDVQETEVNIPLELGPGAIIQLDKLAGEPVDMLVNGKLIAKGEVVVIDESYGLRISAIVSPMDRMTKLQ